jgi:hypothetical protein
MAGDPLLYKGPVKTFRYPVLSVWQYAIQKATAHRLSPQMLRMGTTQTEMSQFSAAAESFVRGAPMPAVDAFGIGIGDCAKLAAEYAWAEITRNKKRAQELENELKYGGCDPLWSVALAVYLAWKASLSKIPYVRYKALDDFVIPLPAKAPLKIGVIADWGTGLEDAQWLLSEVMKQQPDLLIHLGDIYYAGMPEEVRDHFLTMVQAAAPGMPVYTLSGNHDMYSGGKPYYWLLGQLNQAPALQPYRQQASYFCLRNKDWQLLAMDTGYHDCDPFTVTTNLTYLDPKEAKWHADKLANAGGRQTILLSHHQLFTAFGDGVGQDKNGKALAWNPRLKRVFASYLEKIPAWLWGHEHNLEIFQPYLGLQRGRCVGASAIPLLASQDPYTPNPKLDTQGQGGLPLLDPQAPELSLNGDQVYFHAFAVLTLGGPGDGGSSIGYFQVDSSNSRPAEKLFEEGIG